MNRLAAKPFPPAGLTNLQPPLSYRQTTQNHSSLQQQQHPQQYQSSAPPNSALQGTYSIPSSASKPGNTTISSAQEVGSTAAHPYSSTSMSKVLKNVPPHLHEIHLTHLKDCKARKFIPNKAKPEHPSHPLYHQFLERLIQVKNNLRKANTRRDVNNTNGKAHCTSSTILSIFNKGVRHGPVTSGGSSSVPVVDLCESSPPAVATAVRATSNYYTQQMPYHPGPMMLMSQPPVYLSMPMGMTSQPIYSIQQIPHRLVPSQAQAMASNIHPPMEPVQNKAATLSPSSSSLQKRKHIHSRISNLENVLKTLENVVGQIKKTTSRMSKIDEDSDLNHTVRYSKSVGLHSASSTFDSRKMLHTLRLKKGLDYGEWCAPGRVVGLHSDGIEPADNQRAVVIFVVTSSPSVATVECEVPNPSSTASSSSSSSLVPPRKRMFLCNSGIVVVSIPNHEEVTEFRTGETNGLVYVDRTGTVHLTCDPAVMHRPSEEDRSSYNRVFGIAVRSTACFREDGSLAESMGVRGVPVLLFSQMDFHTYQDQMCGGWRFSTQELNSLQEEVVSMSAIIKEQKNVISHQSSTVKDLTRKVRQRLQDIQYNNNRKQKSKSTGSLEV